MRRARDLRIHEVGRRHHPETPFVQRVDRAEIALDRLRALERQEGADLAASAPAALEKVVERGAGADDHEGAAAPRRHLAEAFRLVERSFAAALPGARRPE